MNKSMSTAKIKKTNQASLTNEFKFENLDLGLATALGNSFRQLLKTRVPGWAIFAVKISDKEKTIASEFQNLKGITEVTLYLIFHLKKLVFQAPQQDSFLEEKKSPVFKLQINIDNSQSKESYVVTGKDVRGDLKVINPEIYLTTMEEGCKLNIDLYCRYYQGSYTASEQREQKIFPDVEENILFLPSDYCPVKIVSFKVEESILNKHKENLILTVTTNGGVSPHDSLLSIVNFLEQIMLDIKHQLAIGEKKANKIA